jgi:8-oxo-dGTP diphosphatase
MPITEPEGWIPVAVGIARDPMGRLLVGQRPACKDYPGKWEFPGGKLESGESVYKALVREFREELGLEITRAEPAFVVRHHYPDRSVELNVWRVIDFLGKATGLEDQVVCWVAPRELAGLDFLDGNQTLVERVIGEAER